MALPAEPRQKMINLMYLVLTAMLALNVSAEILNAFRTVDNSLMATNSTINASTGTILSSLQQKLNDPQNREKALTWYPRAQKAQQLSADMYEYIGQLRKRIMAEAGFKPSKENNFDSSFKADNLDIATRILVEEGEGKKLKQKLQDYKTALLGIDPAIAKEFQNSLQIDLGMPKVQDKSNKTWEGAYFHMVPTIAAVTILSKFQNDVKTSENKIVAFCHQQVGQVEVRFDKFAPIVGQSSNYLMPGQELTITAGVGAFNSQALPEISIGGVPQKVQGGIATFTTKASSLGEGSVPVHIRYKDQDGKWQELNPIVKYTVGQSSTAIALPEMNVLYIGYPNKVTVSGGGVGAEKISISVKGGGANAVKNANGQWTVNVGQQTDECIITAFAEGKEIGASSYRVRQMPSPNATVGGKKSGDYVSAPAMAAQPGVGAYIENFPLPLKYTVTKFTTVGIDENGDVIKQVCPGNQFTNPAKALIKGMKSGDILTIEDIYCTGPDGRTSKLPSLLYNIN